MYAAVDLGSNSFRLHIGQHDGKAIRVLKTARDQIRLAAGLDRDGNLTPAAMETALASLRGFGALLAGYQLDAVRVVATSAMRTARNAQAFLPQAEAALGYPIDIISGEEEGRLIYMGVSYALGDSDERRLVIDIGGGSTELILGAGAQIEQVESYSIGTVPHSQAFFLGGAITEQGFDAAVLAARSRFEDAVPQFARRHWQRCHGSSGTMRTLAETIARNGIGDGRLTLASLQALRERLIGFGHVERIALPGIKAERAPSIAGGLAILLGIALELEIDEIHPVDAGLRMGVMADLHLRATRRDRRELSVRAFLRKFQADEARALRVAADAQALYAQLRPAEDTYSRLLYWSGALHEIGMAVSHTGYHKHAAYMIENGDLPGFTTRELRGMSALVLNQKGNLRKTAGLLDDTDFAKAVLALRLAVLLMHTRADLDVAQTRVRMKSRIELELPTAWLAQHPTLAVWLDKERDAWDAIGMPLQLRTQAL